MQEIGLQDVCRAIEQAFKEEDLTRVEALLWPALDQFPHVSQLWFYGGCVFHKRGFMAAASQLFMKAFELDDAPHILSNLGACYRRMNLHNEGIQILSQAVERDPNYCPALVNLASMFVNEGCPEKGIPHLERVMSINPEAEGAAWNLGLLYLESARFADGFDLYRAGVKRERQVRNYGTKDGSLPEPVLLTPESFGEVRKAGNKPKLIVHGEQGIGDELMAATMLNDATEDFDIVFECHPRLERLHRNSTWANKLRQRGESVGIYPTRKEEWVHWPVTDKVTAQYKCPILDLASYYRRDLQSFKTAWQKYGPTYNANEDEAFAYMLKLDMLASDRPIVGLATHGGVVQTSRSYRTIRQDEIDRLMKETNAVFVSLDYDDMTPLAGYVADTYGEDRFRWWPSIVQHFDFDHTAALVIACDLVLTVCQSAFHLSAGLGKKTLCLTPKRCAWRYAPIRNEPELAYWYASPDVRLLRQDDSLGWAEPLTKAIAEINAIRKEAREAA